MKSFVFWLTTFAAFGALLAMILHPGPVEILVVWAAVNQWRGHARDLACQRRFISPSCDACDAAHGYLRPLGRINAAVQSKGTGRGDPNF